MSLCRNRPAGYECIDRGSGCPNATTAQNDARENTFADEGASMFE
ncbi:MAG: hypothetical protein ABSE62_03055 [Chthoniobacteraceae bacterium]